MTTIRFPSNLHCVRRSGFSHSLGDDRKQTNADDGPPRTRRQRSMSADTIQLTIDTDLNGKQTFEKFFKETTFKGSLPFWMTDLILDSEYIKTSDGFQLQTADGEPILITSFWLCMFTKQQPQFQYIGPQRWDINFSVSVMP